MESDSSIALNDRDGLKDIEDLLMIDEKTRADTTTNKKTGSAFSPFQMSNQGNQKSKFK